MPSHSTDSSFDGYGGSMGTSLDRRGSSAPLPTDAFLTLSSAASSGAKLISFAALILASATTAAAAPAAVLQNTTVALALPALQFGAITGVVGMVAWFRPRGFFGGGRIGLGKAEAGERRRVLAVGLLSVVTALLDIWQARNMGPRIGPAIEVFIMPTLSLLGLVPLLSAGVLRISPEAAATCFLLAFGLGGARGSFEGLPVAILRVVLESGRWLLLKQGLSGEKKGAFLQAASMVACFASLIILVLEPLITSPSSSSSSSIDLSAVALFTAAAISAQLILIFTLHHFQSPISVASHLFPRNLILLGVSTLGRDGIALVAEWQKIAFVLAGGSIATISGDLELAAAFRERTRRTRRRLGLTGATTNQNSDAEDEGELPASPAMPHGPRRRSSQRTSSPSVTLGLLPFLPLVFLFAQSAPSSSPSFSAACAHLPPSLRTSRCALPSHARTVDLVFAYFDEQLEGEGGFREHLDGIRGREFVKERVTRVMVYNKGPKSEEELRRTLALSGRDEVIALPNLGREGATYLQHILLHYNDTALSSAGIAPLLRSPPRSRILADHTFFQQPHLAWPNVASPRMDQIAADTGFASLGPILRTDCGSDGRGTGHYEWVKPIYEIFEGRPCPPGGQLSSWSAQLVVSRRRIMRNSYERYAAINELMEAPEGHWIHNTWGANNANGPSNPAFGHSLERSWPIIFGCIDPTIADNCPDDVHERTLCQCLDD